MKEFKGTPGPWRDEGIYIGSVYWPFQVAEVTNFFGHEEQDECNKKLIAASPSLLSAIQRLVEVYDNEAGKKWTTSSKKAAIAEARAAIAKALGEQP